MISFLEGRNVSQNAGAGACTHLRGLLWWGGGAQVLSTLAPKVPEGVQMMVEVAPAIEAQNRRLDRHRLQQVGYCFCFFSVELSEKPAGLLPPLTSAHHRHGLPGISSFLLWKRLTTDDFFLALEPAPRCCSSPCFPLPPAPQILLSLVDNAFQGFCSCASGESMP